MNHKARGFIAVSAMLGGGSYRYKKQEIQKPETLSEQMKRVIKNLARQQKAEEKRNRKKNKRRNQNVR